MVIVPSLVFLDIVEQRRGQRGCAEPTPITWQWVMLVP